MSARHSFRPTALLIPFVMTDDAIKIAEYQKQFGVDQAEASTNS
jgi:hypothetical protein